MHSKAIALVLGILSFVPPFNGLLRFYLKQPLLGVLYTLTCGGLFVGNILDVVQIPHLVRKANMKMKRRELEAELFAEPDQIARLEDRANRESAHQDSIERVILKSAKQNGGCTTASEIALAADFSIDEARHALDVLVSKGFAEVRVTKQGSCVYCVVDLLPPGGPELDDGL